MNREVCRKSPEEVKGLLNELNLDCIKFKLMDPKEGEGWSREKAEEIDTQYRRFLFLCVCSGKSIVPTGEVDAFWHQHILDTRKYAEDCDTVFGYFLHHFPYFGMRGPEDAENLKAAFAETRVLYEVEFGEPYGNESTDCENCSNCGASCGIEGSAIQERMRPTLKPLAV